MLEGDQDNEGNEKRRMICRVQGTKVRLSQSEVLVPGRLCDAAGRNAARISGQIRQDVPEKNETGTEVYRTPEICLKGQRQRIIPYMQPARRSRQEYRTVQQEAPPVMPAGPPAELFFNN